MVASLRYLRHRLHLQATFPSPLASDRAELHGCPATGALRSRPALRPAWSSDASVTLMRWVSICYGRGEGGRVPQQSAL